MALPRLTIKLFPVREPSGDLERSGSLQIPLADVHALCEWLLSQRGTYDNYLQTEVVSLAAQQYSNRSRSGAAYLSVQQPGFDTVRAADTAGSPWTAGLRHADHGSVPRMVAAAGGRIWSPHAADLDAGRVAEARALGLRVLPWTVNDPVLMGRLMDWGVDGLITDRPDLLRAVMAARGIALPPTVPAAPAVRR